MIHWNFAVSSNYPLWDKGIWEVSGGIFGLLHIWDRCVELVVKYNQMVKLYKTLKIRGCQYEYISNREWI